jgi:hypothetical protein
MNWLVIGVYITIAGWSWNIEFQHQLRSLGRQVAEYFS